MENNSDYKPKGMSKVVFIVGVVIFALIILVGLSARTLISEKEDINESDNNVDAETGDEDNGNNNTIVSDTYIITYEEEEYTTKDASDNTITINKRNLPVITNEAKQEVADKIISSLTSISDEEWANIKKSADELGGANEIVGVNYLISTGVVTENRLTFIINEEGSFGGVTWTGTFGYNYSASTGALLTLEDISSDYTSLKNILYEKIVEIIKSSDYVDDLNNDSVSGIWTEQVLELMDDTGNWYFTNSGLAFAFPKYSIGPGSVGVVSVTVDKSYVNDYLNDEFKF